VIGAPSGGVGNKPQITIDARRARVVHHRTKVKLTCSTAACRGTLALRTDRNGKMIVLGHASYDIASGRSRTIVLRISRLALRLLANTAHHRLRAMASATLLGGSAADRAVSLRS
jgi:hypothetical protein